nr:hypothetical transcript [Hymenolepis microstoma]CUU98123.1 hypothetical transcript [Hymenolepis microstoma]
MEKPAYTDVPPEMYEQAVTHTPHIRHHGTKIPLPEKPHTNYPTRNTSVELPRNRGVLGVSADMNWEESIGLSVDACLHLGC